ncbi:hypothetical protein B484DRAFT_403193, partial [Ochromonadaceae sp. CCMP2298]
MPGTEEAGARLEAGVGTGAWVEAGTDTGAVTGTGAEAQAGAQAEAKAVPVLTKASSFFSMSVFRSKKKKNKKNGKGKGNTDISDSMGSEIDNRAVEGGVGRAVVESGGGMAAVGGESAGEGGEGGGMQQEQQVQEQQEQTPQQMQEMQLEQARLFSALRRGDWPSMSALLHRTHNLLHSWESGQQPLHLMCDGCFGADFRG